ncbi:MAG: hypothetical protein QXF79_03510 [Ignisphaera sp.]
MNLITVLRRIENNMEALIKELESKNMKNLAQTLQVLVIKMKTLEKLCLFTNNIISSFRELEEKAKDITKKAIETPTTASEGLKDLAQALVESLTLITNNYTKLKAFILSVLTVYTIISMRLVNIFVNPSISLIITPILLCQGLALVFTLSTDLTVSLFIIPSIPLTSIVTLYLTVNNFDQTNALIMLFHVITLALSTIFVSKNVKGYNSIKRILTELAITIEKLTDIIKKTTKVIPSTIDLTMYTDVYGDKAYELIKYLNDIRKLSE